MLWLMPKKVSVQRPRPITPKTFAAVYEYNCNGGPTANELIYFVRHDKSNKVAYLRSPTEKRTAIKYSGKSFKTNDGS